MIGKIFGKRTVLYETEPAKSGQLVYVVQCSCGSIGKVMGADLRKGRSQECRSCSSARKIKRQYKYKSLLYEFTEGMKIGDRTILYETEPNKYNHRSWACQCKCGKIDVVPGYALRRRSSDRCLECRDENKKQKRINNESKND